MTTTTIQQEELTTELQELYLKGKQWISEMDFQQDETKFLKKHLAAISPLQEKQQNYEDISQTTSQISYIEASQLRLVQEIRDFMQFVSTLANVSDPDIDSRLLQWNTRLENEINTNFVNFGEFKRQVLHITGNSL